MAFESKDEVVSVSDLKNTEDVMHLISRNCAETIGLDDIKQKLEDGKFLVGYWGTAPTRSPSIGYLVPLMKFRDLINAGVNMTIMLADIHYFLDKGASWAERVTERSNYYQFLLTELLLMLDVTPDSYEFRLGSEFQLSPSYIMELLKFVSHISASQAKRAGSDLVKQDKDPKLSSLVYPLMQVIDESVLNADIELGGTDQRKIFMLSRDHVSKLGRSRCSYVMNELLPSLGKPGTKMNSTDTNGKI